MTNKEQDIRNFREFAASRLDEIANILRGDPIITLIIRFANHPSQDVLMTMDTIEEIENLLQRRKSPESGSFYIPADEPV